MTEEERKRHFGTLVEILYSQLRAISEGTIPNKKGMSTKIIFDFYKDYKEDYGIESIETILKELERVDKNMKEIHNKEENDGR